MRKSCQNPKSKIQNCLTSSLTACLLFLSLSSLSSCANTGAGEALERSFAPDPQLGANSSPTPAPSSPAPSSSAPSSTPANSPADLSADLPADFPEEIPRYPNAKLLEVEPANDSAGILTRWQSSDSSESIYAFYKAQFQDSGWQLLPQPANSKPNNSGNNSGNNDANSSANSSANNSGKTLKAKRNDLQAIASFVDRENNDAPVEFVLEYDRLPEQADSTATPDSEKAGTASPTTAAAPVAESPLEKLPPQLRQYSEDLLELGVFSLEQSGSKDNSKTSISLLEPITRREYARWLLAANNKIYANKPTQQIRPATAREKPAFQDLPATDPDFPDVQGLADAGIIPSTLSGDSTVVSFRPDAPLTREDMLLWKVPLDTRKTLAKASVDAVKETWGFQDAAKIEPKALRAVLADFQNGDFANIRRSFGYTTLLQPKKSVTRAEAAAALWYFGVLNEGLSAREAIELENKQQTE